MRLERGLKTATKQRANNLVVCIEILPLPLALVSGQGRARIKIPSRSFPRKRR